MPTVPRRSPWRPPGMPTTVAAGCRRHGGESRSRPLGRVQGKVVREDDRRPDADQSDEDSAVPTRASLTTTPGRGPWHVEVAVLSAMSAGQVLEGCVDQFGEARCPVTALPVVDRDVGCSRREQADQERGGGLAAAGSHLGSLAIQRAELVDRALPWRLHRTWAGIGPPSVRFPA